MKRSFLPIIALLILALSFLISACGGGGGGSSAEGLVANIEEESDEHNGAIETTTTSTTTTSTTTTSTTDTTLLQNDSPTAYSLTLEVDNSFPYLIQTLIADDPDNDALTFELVSDSSGKGYIEAYLNPDSGTLYVTVDSTYSGEFILLFRVTDGFSFSEEANVVVAVSSIETHYYGYSQTDAKTYLSFDSSVFDLDTYGNPGADASVPPSMDLSANFPSPGHQQNQSSCVGWAVGYAVKSYHERMEIGWSLNSASRIFSPAYIYNQINQGEDNGAAIADALNLLKSKGAATWSTMPYNPNDYLSAPSSAANTEAAQFKSKKWAKLTSVVNGIKGALANKIPVIAGMLVYNSMRGLKGSNSVYNNVSGAIEGGHAIAIVGYDDNLYGGAFKVINSWGQDWGNAGFFWITYNLAPDVIQEAYILEDSENEKVVDSGEQSTEIVVESLPNLQVKSWRASYDPTPNGAGWLEYEIVNSGNGTAKAGSGMCLMLSSNTTIRNSDSYVVCETIPFDLESGHTAFRNSFNRIFYNFPEHITDGNYYMAVWIDDFNSVTESNESDNVSIGDSFVEIRNEKPDLKIRSWYTYWYDDSSAYLEYEVENIGASAAPSNWDVALVLSTDYTIGNGNEYYLFFENTPFALQPGGSVYRDSFNPASYNISYDIYGNPIPDGTYYMAIWADDLNKTEESNELNNISMGSQTLTYGNNRVLRNKHNHTNFMYNGRKLPTKQRLLKEIELYTDSTGRRKVLDKSPYSRSLDSVDQKDRFYSLTNQSKDAVIVPIEKSIPLP